MNHIEYNEIEEFFNLILNPAKVYSLWRVRFIIKYKFCDIDSKWHELMHNTILSYMMLQFNDKKNKFRKTTTIQLGLSATDFILYWKLNPIQYKKFLKNIEFSQCIGHLSLEFGSLYKLHSNYSYIIINIFNSISKNKSISALALKICSDDSNSNNNNGLTQNDADLTSLLSKEYDDNKLNNKENEDNEQDMEYISNCFKNKIIDIKYSGNNACLKKIFINLVIQKKIFH